MLLIAKKKRYVYRWREYKQIESEEGGWRGVITWRNDVKPLCVLFPIPRKYMLPTKGQRNADQISQRI